MKLRLRLVVSAITAAAGTTLALMSMDLRARRDEAAEYLIANVERLLAAPGARARCEAAPMAWGPPNEELFGKGILHVRPERGGRDVAPPPPRPPLLDPRLRPVELFPLDGDLRPAGEQALKLDRELLRTLPGFDAVRLPSGLLNDSVAVLVKTAWSGGPCAHVYARGHVGLISRRLRPLPWLLPVASVLGAVLVTMVPVVRRIRRLADAVEASAVTGFAGEIPVEGHDEIADLARSFAAASRAVRAQVSATEQREASLRDFLANTTHDVMIPLTVLQGHLAALQQHEQAEHAGGGAKSAPLTSAMDEAQYIGALLQNLAAVAKLDSGAWQPMMGVVDLNALVHRVVSRHQAVSRRLDVAIGFAVPDDPVFVAGDITLLEQAVSNVVYNAVRHNRAGGHVAVVLDATATDRFSLRVSDDGPGVPADELARLSQRGFRGGAARTRSPEGLGLGLDITSRVAGLHGFELRFGPSEPGGLQVNLEGPQLHPITERRSRSPGAPRCRPA